MGFSSKIDENLWEPYVGTLKTHRETLLFQYAPWVHQFCHDDVLLSWDHLPHQGHVWDAWICIDLIQKLIKRRVIWIIGLQQMEDATDKTQKNSQDLGRLVSPFLGCQ